MPTYDLNVNGRSTSVTVSDPQQPLLYALRNALGLTGAKYGCGLGQCGSCTVHVDGKAVRSCTLPVSAVGKRAVTTLEGLGSPDKPHPVQAAFIQEQAAQCGYCTNGMVMTSVAFLKQKPSASLADIKAALSGNLCRCGTHHRIERAVVRARDEMKKGQA
ncbi:MAG: (2Fe-2S)-binding protein [Limnohabitans sp.]|nr:(2Fe-2S)-binding protein [Limnohabitans sp.]